MPRKPVATVCVFCGSRTGSSPPFADAAVTLGRAIARRGLTLVYGGAKVGLMGLLADAALSEGGRVVGILPRALVSTEIAHDGLTELFITDSMHARKERMILLSDAFVSMPGGFGTYDEFFEVLTLAQIGFHDKPNALFNVDGYFAPLVSLLGHTLAHGFAGAEHEKLFLVEEDVERLLDAIGERA